jgi:hypothetical protein
MKRAAADLILRGRFPGLFWRTILPFPEASEIRGDGKNPVPHPQIICRMLNHKPSLPCRRPPSVRDSGTANSKTVP